MTDSHFSDLRNRSSNRDRSSICRSTSQLDRLSSQFRDKSSSQFHNKFSNRQFQRIEFDIRFFKFFQNVKNRFFTIEKNLEYINDCLKQYTEKRIENQIL